MIVYASRTGTKKNLDVFRGAGWRLLVSATGVWRHEGFSYALDNGAWTAHQKGTVFDVNLFYRLISVMGAEADFVVVPDIVGGGIGSLELSIRHLPRLLSELPESVRVLIPVQEGIGVADIEPLISRRVGIFIGGASDAWKVGTMSSWAALVRRHGSYCHVGRVNTKKRIKRCYLCGVDSFDGSGVSRWKKHAQRVAEWTRQEVLFVDC